MIEDHAATQWLLRHPAAAAGLGSAAIFGLSSRARDGVLSVLGRCYLFVYPPDRSPIALHTENTERPIPLAGNSRFARHPKELRRVAKERGVTVAQLLQDAVNDCSIQPKEGELVNCWDLLTVWGPDNLNSEQLESWRQVSDEPSDVALLDLEKERPVRPDEDVIARIRKTAETETGARELWQQVSARPPPGCGALSKEWYDARRGNPASIEEELSAEAVVLKRGQEVFWKYYAAMLTVLLHHSLAGGFASPRIVRVLEQTGYLLPKSTMESGKNLSQASADRSWVRLLETTQWVLDVMERGVETLMPPSEAQPEGGQGWRSTVRVRMLHAKVRRRIMKNAAALEGRHDVAADGIPINQEDLAATLGSFSVSPLLSLLRLGLRPTLQEREDFVALWRHIGYYMGVSPDILTRHYSSAKVADQFLFSVVRHMFSELETTLRRGEQPPPGATMPLLTAVSKRKPFFTPLEAHCGISRQLMGPRLASALRVPATSPKLALILEFTYFTLWYPVWFGSIYRASWERTRITLARPFLRRLIIWSMGEKEARYFGGEEEENAGVPLDEHVGKQLVGQWKRMMREMILVSAAVVALPVLLVGLAYTRR